MTYIERVKEIIATCELEYNQAKQVFIEKEQRLDLARSEYQRVCSHDNKEEEKTNYPGGYDYKAEHHIDTYCKDCGAFLGRETTYGTFG